MALFSSYKLYKQGTSQVVAWLGKVAAQCGYQLRSAEISKQENKAHENGSSSNPDRSSEAERGSADTSKQQEKAKRIQGSKNCRESSSKSESRHTKYTVSIRELPVLARVILEHIQQTSNLKRVQYFKTLPSILQVLKDVIVKRKQWAKAFGQTDEITLTNNEQHKHFVNVLEDVYQILEGVISALQLGRKQPSEEVVFNGKYSSMEETALSNLFAVLDIEETADEENPIPRPVRSPSLSRPATVSYELEDETDKRNMWEEACFIIHCFFNDFVGVRRHIAQSWADYTSGLLDLPAVAVTTNVALEMLQRAEIELFDSLPRRFNLTNYEGVALFFQMAVACEDYGIDSKLFVQGNDVIDMDLKALADFTCWPVYVNLRSFLQLLEGIKHFPVFKPDHFGEIDMSGQPLSWRKKFIQDKIVLFELLPEFFIVNRFKATSGPIPVVDELSCGLEQMMWKKRIPLWLVLGCQIYLDIHHTMLLDIGMAHRELQKTGLHFSTTLQDYFDFSKEMTMDTWPEINNQCLRRIKEEADLYVNQDFLATTKKRFFKSVNLPKSAIRPYSLLSRNPILCGLMHFRLNLSLQEAGVNLVNGWGSLASVIHLYNAVKHEASEDGFPLWKDVEAIIKIQGKERIFVGDYPRKPEEYMKRFCLVMGYSASIFARNRRGGSRPLLTFSPASKRGPREMIKTSVIADIFRGQYGHYCGNETRSEVTFHKIEELLGISVGKHSCSGSNHRPRPFTSGSFLCCLQAHIQSDILALNINYFALHIRCIDLLRDIYNELDNPIRKYLGPKCLEERACRQYFPFLVWQILVIGSTYSGKVAESLECPGWTEVAKSTALMKAGKLIKEMVQKEGVGDQELERVKSVCHLQCGIA